MLFRSHTSPLKTVNITLDYLFTYCIGRIAVPFFLMVTGYFVLAPYYSGEETAVEKVKNYLIKILCLYGMSILLYLPVTIYAGQLPKSPGAVLKELIFDGTFYHLWYLPATLLGCIVVLIMMKLCKNKWTGRIAFILYIIGMFGDSYYGIISGNFILKKIYEGIFLTSSYTRNGIFYVPIFLWIGIQIARRGTVYSKKAVTAGFCLSLALMMAEGFLTWHFKIQKHNSMYLFLIPVMFFLFRLLVQEEDENREKRDFSGFRSISMWIYIIHPLCIIVVRGCAKLTNLNILVENFMVHYLLVCIVSGAGAVSINWIWKKARRIAACIGKEERG